MDQKLWTFIERYRGHFDADNYLIALSYYYLSTLENEQPKSEILNTSIKKSFAEQLSQKELAAIDLFLEEKLGLEEIHGLLIHFLNLIDYSRQTMRASSNDSILNLASRFFTFDEGNFADFCSGNGTMLSKALENQAQAVYGIEIDEISYQLSILRLWLEHGVLLTDQIQRADVFDYFEDHDEQFKQIFSEFPIGLTREKSYMFEGVEIPRRSDWGFIALVMNQLQTDGRAVVISPVSIETRKPDQEIREHFIREGYIEQVIALPGGILSGTAIPSFMLVLSHGNERIRFTDASESYSSGGRVRFLSEEDIDAILEDDVTTIDVPIKQVLSKGRLSPEFYLLPEVVDGEKLSELVDILNSRSVRKKEMDEYSSNETTGFEVIRLSHVKDGKIIGGDFIKGAMPNLVELEDLDILVTRTGSKLNVALYTKEEDLNSFVDENFFVLRVKNKQVTPYYLFTYLQSEMGQKYLSSSYSGATIQRINKGDLAQLEIPLVDAESQQLITEKTAIYLEEIEQLELALATLEDELNEAMDSWFKED